MPRRRPLAIAPEVADLIRVLAPNAKRKMGEAIEAIREDPTIGSELVRELSGLRRLRVGQLRVVYRVASRHVQVIAIGPRATIYVDLEARQRRGESREPPRMFRTSDP